jgi:hypothetical protein
MAYFSDRPTAPTGEPVSRAVPEAPDIETILAEVLVRTDPSKRASYLDQTCAIYPELRQQAEQWAQLIEETVDALESPATASDADSMTESFVLPSDDELAAHLARPSISIGTRLAAFWRRIKELLGAKGENGADATPRTTALEYDEEAPAP